MPKHLRDSYLRGVQLALEAVLLVVVVGAALAAVVVPRLGGATPYAVLTGSMRPAMPPGTLVVVRDVAPASIRAGDVITFMPYPDDPSVVTHRVVAVGFDATGELAFRTRGDANPVPDTWAVHARQLVGKRWYFVPYLGYLTAALTGAQRTVLVLVLAGALFLYALVMFAGALRDRLRRPMTEVAGA